MIDLFFDLESDGLLNDATLVHCLGHYHERYVKGPGISAGRESIVEELDAMRLGDYRLIGHNVIGFDLPLLKKLYHFQVPQERVLDTLVLARFIFPDTLPEDAKLVAKGKLPKGLMGSHSLEAWGHRLGVYKGDFKGPWKESEVRAAALAELHAMTPPKDDMDMILSVADEEYIEAAVAAWRKEMQEYCKQDVVVTKKLFEHCMAQNPSWEAVELEHKVQGIIQRQIRHGIRFDTDRAIELAAEMHDAHARAEKVLVSRYRGWFAPVSPTPERAVKIPARSNKTLGYVEGVPFTAVKYVEFNPGSRAHLIKVLKAEGWVPKKFTDAGNPKLDDEVLKGMTGENIDAIRQYLLIEKRLGQISEGKEAWLKHARNGRIHGSVNTNGAVTGRMTHSSPNLAQVPSVPTDDEGHPVKGEAGGWGYECRELFCVPQGKRQVGCDASGLELRMLAHYMGRYDGGVYGHEVVNGDIHTVNQHAAGLPTRKNAKTFILIIWDDLGATPRLKLCELREHPTGSSAGNPEPRACAITFLYEKITGPPSLPTLEKSHVASARLPTRTYAYVKVQRPSLYGSTAKRLEAHSPPKMEVKIWSGLAW